MYNNIIIIIHQFDDFYLDFNYYFKVYYDFSYGYGELFTLEDLQLFIWVLILHKNLSFLIFFILLISFYLNYFKNLLSFMISIVIVFKIIKNCENEQLPFVLDFILIAYFVFLIQPLQWQAYYSILTKKKIYLLFVLWFMIFFEILAMQD